MTWSTHSFSPMKDLWNEINSVLLKLEGDTRIKYLWFSCMYWRWCKWFFHYWERCRKTSTTLQQKPEISNSSSLVAILELIYTSI